MAVSQNPSRTLHSHVPLRSQSSKLSGQSAAASRAVMGPPSRVPASANAVHRFPLQGRSGPVVGHSQLPSMSQSTNLTLQAHAPLLGSQAALRPQAGVWTTHEPLAQETTLHRSPGAQTGPPDTQIVPLQLPGSVQGSPSSQASPSRACHSQVTAPVVPSRTQASRVHGLSSPQSMGAGRIHAPSLQRASTHGSAPHGRPFGAAG